MTAAPIRLTWRTWTRAALLDLFGFAAGVLALTPDAPISVRVVAVAVFAAGAFWTLDLIGFVARWNVSQDAVLVPTILDHDRAISRSADLLVRVDVGARSRFVIDGARGRRTVGVNPLVSRADLDRWAARWGGA